MLLIPGPVQTNVEPLPEPSNKIVEPIQTVLSLTVAVAVGFPLTIKLTDKRLPSGVSHNPPTVDLQLT